MARNKKIKILSVVGARPNMMKIAPLIEEMKIYKDIEPLLLHTGQHYDRRMSKIFFKELAIPEPDIYLGSGSASHAKQTADIMIKLEKALLDIKPDLVLVVGDVNSTMAAALTASKMTIPVAHVEAGLRSFDRTMPEEINRIVTDSVSDYLFAPSSDAVENLKNEGHPRNKIFFVGNIMIDTLLKHKKRSDSSAILEDMRIKRGQYGVLTLHRPCNVDSRNAMIKILRALEVIQKNTKIIFPMHSRTKKMVQKFGLTGRLKKMKNVNVVFPMGYLDFLKLLCNSSFVLTDSGGIQEETTVLGVPCITLRDTTERPSTITLGTNVLTGNDTNKILAAIKEGLIRGGRSGKIPKLWDGRTSRRIVRIIRERLA